MDTETKRGVKSTNLLEIFSVSIQRFPQEEHNDVGSSFEVYGHIKLTNDYGKEFFIFKHEHDDPVTVSMLDNKTAILPKPEPDDGYSPRWLPKYFWLELYLVDKTRSVTIVDDSRKLDFQHKVLYDEEQTIFFDRIGYGRVTLNYAIFRHALLAIASLQVYKNLENSATDDESDVVVVSGIISANTEVKGERGLERVLCDIQSMSLKTNDGHTYLPAIAVPAYSLLRIKADLVVNNDERIVITSDEALEFEPVDPLSGPHTKAIMGEKWRIHLSVFWFHPYSKPDEEEFVGELPGCRLSSRDELLESEEGYWNFEDLLDDHKDEFVGELPNNDDSYFKECLRIEDLLYEVYSCSSIEETQQNRNQPFGFDRPLVEVFSVSVASFHHERPLRVYGTIKYDNHKDEPYSIFERDETRPETVLPNQPIPLLERPHCHEGTWFNVHLDLKDARGREISKGCLRWCMNTALDWYDKRICSVVKGDHGFACVHYAILDDAVCAKVRVSLISSDNDNRVCGVSGSVYARYSTYRCSTKYEESFYRSRLFKRKDSCGLLGETDVPLSKDVVAVPCHTGLLLEMKLHVQA